MADEPKIYNLTLDDGSIVKGTAEEIVATVGKMKTDTSAALKAEREQREALQTQVNGLVQQFRDNNKPKPVAGAFDNDNFYSELNRSPSKAIVSALAHELGIPAEQLPGAFQELTRDVSSVKQQMISGQFWQKHGHEFDPKYADTLTDKFGDLVKHGYPADLRTLETGFRELVDEGKVKLLEKKPDKEAVKEEPNPSLTGAGDTAIPQDEMAKMNTMPMDELEKLMREKGVLK